MLVSNQILAPSAPSCLITPFSRVCLILSAVLAGMFTCDNSQSSVMLSHVMPDDEVVIAEQRQLESMDTDALSGQLSVLIKLTTRCIMEISEKPVVVSCTRLPGISRPRPRTDYKFQNSRIKFYGVLTYLLEIVLKICESSSLVVSSFNYCLRAARLKPTFSGLVNECNLIINNHSLLMEKISEKSLYSTVCCDCISGNIHLALSALTVLDCVASVDRGSGGLVTYLTSHGYLNVSERCYRISPTNDHSALHRQLGDRLRQYLPGNEARS